MQHLETFLEDIPFPIDKDGLVHESLDSSLPINVREAIALLPDREYSSRAELKEDLFGVSFDDGIPKKDMHETESEDVDDAMDGLVDLNEFTQIGDEENQEAV